MSETGSVNPYAAPTVIEGMVGIRQNFPDIPTKELKNLRNDSHSIRAVAVLLVLGFLINGLVLITGLIAHSSGSRGLDTKSLIVSAFIEAWLLVLAIGLITRPTWARIIGFLAGALLLLGFPIGTLVGALFLVALGRSARLFGQNRILHKPLEVEWRYRKKNKVD